MSGLDRNGRSQRGDEHVGHIAGDPLREPLTRRKERPEADNPDALDAFDLPQSIAVSVVNPPKGMVRRTGDHSDGVALFDPLSTVFICSRRRRINLWWKIMRQKDDVHINSSLKLRRRPCER